LKGPAIGGYFELELPAKGEIPYPEAIRFQSARASFLALLRAGKPKRVWMPRYICDSMVKPLRTAGVAIGYYSIDERFEIVDDLNLAVDEWLFYVNYFGICAANVDRILSRFNAAQVVLDHAQAFYAPPRACLATIFSPRKFFGVPDGGLLVTKLAVATPAETDGKSVERSTHLLRRLLGDPELGYAEYQHAEQTLDAMEPLQMSALTSRLLGAADFEAVRVRRNANFRLLHASLGQKNRLTIDLDSINGPLCYPYLGSADSLRETLIRQRVFVAKYWTDVLSAVDQDSCEARLTHGLIPFPCDQRYGEAEMKKIADICAAFVGT
jgi:hypothetical protein